MHGKKRLGVFWGTYLKEIKPGTESLSLSRTFEIRYSQEL